jgi:biopolymer transport protein ExbD
MGANVQGSSRGRGSIVGINVTPMVDVVLVLLVIMMVSAQYIVSRSIRVELPRAANADEGGSSPTQVIIRRDRGLLLDQRPVTEAALSEGLRRALARDRELSLVVMADRDVSHGTVMRVVDLARGVGITKFAISVERPE